jgi:hypothetical protein
LGDEIGKRQGAVNEMLQHVKDEHVADGFWKKKSGTRAGAARA